jgi:hypothetical protein
MAKGLLGSVSSLKRRTEENVMKQVLKAILTTTAFALTIGIGAASLGSTAAHASYDPAEQSAKAQMTYPD